jgi:hypothetical protein
MPTFGPDISPSAVGRWAFGMATVICALIGLFVDARWFGAAGAFGTIWYLWDLAWENVLGPLAGFLTGAVSGTTGIDEPPELTIDDNIRLLERHLTSDTAPRHVQIQSALRLAEIYRLNRHDDARAAEVIRRAREKWPDAKELEVADTREG